MNLRRIRDLCSMKNLREIVNSRSLSGKLLLTLGISLPTLAGTYALAQVTPGDEI